MFEQLKEKLYRITNHILLPHRLINSPMNLLLHVIVNEAVKHSCKHEWDLRSAYFIAELLSQFFYELSELSFCRLWTVKCLQFFYVDEIGARIDNTDHRLDLGAGHGDIILVE
jgi:hypothetical protein